MKTFEAANVVAFNQSRDLLGLVESLTSSNFQRAAWFQGYIQDPCLFVLQRDKYKEAKFLYITLESSHSLKVVRCGTFNQT